MRASLRKEYGLDLSTVTETHSAYEVADLVVWLPAGSALWVATGGPAAMTSETMRLAGVIYLLESILFGLGGNKGKKPRPPKHPDWAHEREADQVLQDKKARGWLRRQGLA